MITAIYDLRDFGWKQVKAGHEFVQYFKEVKGTEWSITEDETGYRLIKNGFVKDSSFDLQYIVAVMKKHKLLENE
jgi:hypothetical protein